ncbi:MAG TPA: hypothetical protein VKK31_12340 [Thermoanaerobaculia bacterium]|nr:hypothetical protein [Thermoanaerobaculia bacterium]
MPTCDKLKRFNALVPPGAVEKFAPFDADFCLTDLVLDLWSFPDGLDSKAGCGIWLVTTGSSEILFNLFIDKHGQRVSLNSGVLCPKGSYLTANAGVFASGGTADLRVLLTGHDC